MGKKTLILSQKQLDEICGGKCTYFDNTPQYDSNEIYTQDININTSNPTTDDVATDQPNVNRRATRVVNGKTNGLFEVNSNIQTLRFGSENGDTGHTAQATAMSKSRLKKAQQTVQTASTQTEKQKAQKTIDNMMKNSPNLQQQIQQFDAAVRNDKTRRNNAVQNGERVIQPHTKKSGNGKGHTPKNGIITYYE